jgi:hypothetical protein
MRGDRRVNKRRGPVMKTAQHQLHGPIALKVKLAHEVPSPPGGMLCGRGGASVDSFWIGPLLGERLEGDL